VNAYKSRKPAIAYNETIKTLSLASVDLLPKMPALRESDKLTARSFGEHGGMMNSRRCEACICHVDRESC
jgi:hypothetical protein